MPVHVALELLAKLPEGVVQLIYWVIAVWLP